MFKKSKLFDKEGFYIVLFVCLCIVAVTAVYMSKSNSSAPKKVSEIVSKTQPKVERSTDPLLTITHGKNATQPTSKQMVKSTKDVAKEMAKAKMAATKKSKVIHHRIELKLVYPVKGDIVKKFDNSELQESKTLGQWETHEGIDIACEIGTEVKAATSGKVVDVITKDDKLSPNEKDGFGARVIIDNGDGYRTVYANLAVENIKFKKGDAVKEGDVIGVVGDTSLREAVSIEGSHLHFELLKKTGNDYITVNPQQYFK